RIDHQLAGLDRADADIGVPAENRFVARHASPRVDAFEGEVFVGIEIAAYRRVGAVATQYEMRAHWRQILRGCRFLETERYTVIVLFESDTAAICNDGLGTELGESCFVEDGVQAAAMNAHFGIWIAGVWPAWFLIEELAEAVEEGAFLVHDPGR